MLLLNSRKNIKCIRIDNGLEFNMDNFYDSHDIIHQTTCIETFEQNAIVERKHQYILNVARSLLYQADLGKQFWCYVVKHVIFLINRIPTPYLDNISPYEKLYGKLSNIDNIKVFACLCYISTINAKRNKLDLRGNPTIFLGFERNTKGFLVLNLTNHNRSILECDFL